jgi:hypothetical protein
MVGSDLRDHARIGYGPHVDRPKFLSTFKTIGPVRRSADCPRTAGGSVREQSIGPCPTDVNRERTGPYRVR